MSRAAFREWLGCLADPYLPRLEENGFDSEEVLRSLTPEQLAHMFNLVGVHKLGHQYLFQNKLKGTVSEQPVREQLSVTNGPPLTPIQHTPGPTQQPRLRRRESVVSDGTPPPDTGSASRPRAAASRPRRPVTPEPESDGRELVADGHQSPPVEAGTHDFAPVPSHPLTNRRSVPAEPLRAPDVALSNAPSTPPATMRHAQREFASPEMTELHRSAPYQDLMRLLRESVSKHGSQPPPSSQGHR